MAACPVLAGSAGDTDGAGEGGVVAGRPKTQAQVYGVAMVGDVFYPAL